MPNIQSRHLSEVFKNKNVILSQKQPQKLLQLLTQARFNTEINAFGQQNGLFKCKVKRCKICSLYMVESHSFIMSSNMRWELLSRVNNERFELDFKVINHPEFVLQKENFSNNGGLFWTCLLKLKMINFPSSFMIRDGFLFSIVRMSYLRGNIPF